VRKIDRDRNRKKEKEEKETDTQTERQTKERVRDFAVLTNFSSPLSSANNNLVVLFCFVRKAREKEKKR
jgi:hypothetical protein